MYIKYINLSIGNNVGGETYRLIFEFHVRYICNFFSKEVRKFKILNGLEYDCINIVLDNETYCRYSKTGTPGGNVEIGLPFSKERYERTKSSNDDTYYMELLEQSFKKFCSFTNVDYSVFQIIFDKFNKANRKNEWLFKTIKSAASNIKAQFICKFSTDSFQVEAIFYDLQSSSLLCKGMCIRTMPDEIFFTGIFKTVIINETHIIILDYNDNPLILFPVEQIKNRMFHFDYACSPYPDDEQATITYNKIIKELQYDGNIEKSLEESEEHF